jgi:hypothetical protein
VDGHHGRQPPGRWSTAAGEAQNFFHQTGEENLRVPFHFCTKQAPSALMVSEMVVGRGVSDEAVKCRCRQSTPNLKVT